MLDSPMLADQNMVCGSTKDQRDHFPRIQLDVSLFSGIHQICIPTFPLIHPRKVVHIRMYIHSYICKHMCAHMTYRTEYFPGTFYQSFLSLVHKYMDKIQKSIIQTIYQTTYLNPKICILILFQP